MKGPTPAEGGERRGGGAESDSPGYHVTTHMPVTKGFLSWLSTSSHAFRGSRFLIMIDILVSTLWRHGIGKLHLENPAYVATG